jgi:hypothetical protein
MVEQHVKEAILRIGSTKMMCVSHGKALEKTSIRMSIKHQHSLDEMRHKVQTISFPQTQTTGKWVHKLTNKKIKNQSL